MDTFVFYLYLSKNLRRRTGDLLGRVVEPPKLLMLLNDFSLYDSRVYSFGVTLVDLVAFQMKSHHKLLNV